MTGEICYYCRRSKNCPVIPAQKEEFSRFNKEAKLQVAEILEESRSAKYPENRPVFAQMVKDIEAGRAEGIWVWNVNRLSRNSVDTGKIIHLMDIGKLIEVRTLNQVFKNTPNDKFLLNLFCSQAKLENDNRGMDVRRGFRAKLERGQPTGRVCEGYKNSKIFEKGFNIAEKDPERFLLVRKMWDLMLTGNYNPQEILKIASKEWGYITIKRPKSGGKSLSRSAIYRMFTNPFYYGMLLSRKTGELHQGIHEPMVTKEEFDRVQILLGAKGMKRAPHTKEFAHTGQIKCDCCDCQITADEKYQIICSKCKKKFAYNIELHPACPKCGIKMEKMQKPKILHYAYYHCTKRKNNGVINCEEPSVRQEELEKQINEFLLSIAINQQYVDWALKYLKEKESVEEKIATKDSVEKSNERALAQINKRIDGLIDMRSNNELTEDEFKVKKDALTEQKKQIESFTVKQKRNAGNANSETSKALTFAERAWREYQKDDPRKKREILYELGSNLTLSNRILNIHAAEPFIVLKKAREIIPDLNGVLEPEIQVDNKRENLALGEVNPIWLKHWEAFISVRWIADVKYPEYMMQSVKKLLELIEHY